VLITAILVAEYALMFVLIKLGSMALLVGSLSLFAILAVAMYFTLKLKMKNGELTLEK
jgi:inner membrane protein involved in colicin E2 resistance